jgi:hypothetical protein
MRQSSGSIKQARNGAYIHVLQEDPNCRDSIKRSSAATVSNISNGGSGEDKYADANSLEAVYRAFLEALELTDAHGNILLIERGLSDTTIANNLYASVPDDTTAQAVCNMLAHQFDLANVPGFYRESGRWKLDNYHKGYYIPYKDVQGRILGLQIRLDDERKGKYRWFSSEGKPNGTKTRSCLHFIKPDGRD